MPDLIYEKHLDKHYALFKFNRPERMNALTPEMQQFLREEVYDFATDPELRVAIVTGEGKAFSAGADLKTMTEHSARVAGIEARYKRAEITAEQRRAELQAAGGYGLGLYGPDRIPKYPFGACPKPIIAAINGACIAGGMEMAIDCDIRIASTDAYFGLFEAKRGVIAGVGVQHLARVMPAGEAMYLLLLADKWSVERAREVGFVQEVMPPERLMPRALEMAEAIGANAPLSVQGSKAMVQLWRHHGMEEVRRMEEYVWKAVFDSADAKEGPRAFAEKRPPNWQGR